MRVGIGCQEAGGAGWGSVRKDGVTRHVMGIVTSEFRALRVCPAGESVLRELSPGGIRAIPASEFPLSPERGVSPKQD